MPKMSESGRRRHWRGLELGALLIIVRVIACLPKLVCFLAFGKIARTPTASLGHLSGAGRMNAEIRRTWAALGNTIVSAIAPALPQRFADDLHLKQMTTSCMEWFLVLLVDSFLRNFV
jgi:hypothetical protein